MQCCNTYVVDEYATVVGRSLGGQQVDAERGELGAVSVAQTTRRTIVSGVHGTCGKREDFIFFNCKICISISLDVYDEFVAWVRTSFFANVEYTARGRASVCYYYMGAVHIILLHVNVNE